MRLFRYVAVGLAALAALAALAGVAACGRHDAPPTKSIPGHPGYHVQQSVALGANAGAAGPTGGARGSGARLELLEDDRITPVIRAGFQNGLPDAECRRPTSEVIHGFCDAVSKVLLAPALLRLADAAGRDLDTLSLERPIAALMLVIDDPAAGRRVYGVSVDVATEIGPDAGPTVRLLDQRARRIEWLRATDAASGAVEEIQLLTTPRMAWRAAPGGAADANETEIFSVACRPSAGPGGGFQVTYDRYAFADGGWRRHRRVERGFWQNDGTFPPPARFP